MMRRVVWVLGVLLLMGRGLAAQSAGVPALDGDPRAVVYAQRAAAGAGWELLAEISLWASGADPNAPVARGRASYMQTIRGAVNELLRAADLPASGRERGEYVMAFMFRVFLKGYSERQTRIDTLLATGTYNCVSSAVLYAILAAAAGLTTRGVVTKDHAFVTLMAGGEAIDIETTNPYGFDPGNRKDFHDGFGKVTGFVYVPARNYRDRTVINNLELVSLILHNRITEAETRRRHDEAVALVLNRAGLLSGPTDTVYSAFFIDPHRLVVDSLLNYGAALLNDGKEAAALEWAAAAAPRYPDGARWPDFIYAALNNLLGKLVTAGRFDQARALLRENAQRVGPRNYTELDALVARAELVEKVQAVGTLEDVDEVLAILDKAPSGIDVRQLREMRVFSLLKKAEYLAKAYGWPAAIACAEAAYAEYPDPRFGDFLRAARSNRVADLHNAFADEYNKKNYGAANTIIEEALKEFPNDRRLLEDKRLAGRHL